MPVQEFVLDLAGTQRVQVFQDIEGKSLIVLENQRILGSLTAQEAVDTGREFALSDGSTLKAQIVDGQIQVQRNSQILTPISISKDNLQPIMSSAFSIKPDESVGSTRGKRGGCLTTWLIAMLVGGTFFIFSNLSSYSFLAVHGQDASVYWPYLALIFIVINQMVGAIALFLWRKWGFYQILLGAVADQVVLISSNQPAGYIVFVFVAQCIMAATLYMVLHSNDKWELFRW